jgi:hypothetical protein
MPSKNPTKAQEPENNWNIVEWRGEGQVKYDRLGHNPLHFGGRHGRSFPPPSQVPTLWKRFFAAHVKCTARTLASPGTTTDIQNQKQMLKKLRKKNRLRQTQQKKTPQEYEDDATQRCNR